MIPRSTSALGLAWFLGASALAQGELLVASRNTDQVLRYDATSGAPLGVFAAGGGLDNPVGLTFGPDGHLYVASGNTNQVLRYDGASGAFLGVFASGGGLSGARQLQFGPDRDLYVASGATDQILHFDGQSGAFVGVAASGGTLRGPTSFTFGPDGDLYVVSVLNDRVKRYDGGTGAYLGNFVTSHVDGPHDLVFGPDGLLYVSNAFLTRIARFDGATGAWVDDFVSDAALVNALGLTFDASGHLLVANQGGNEVRRYDRETGAYLGSLVAPGAGGLSGALFAAFKPLPGGLVLDAFPLVAGQRNWVHVSGALPGSLVELRISPRAATVELHDCPGRWQVLPHTLARVVADESGQALFSAVVPASKAGTSVFLQPRAAESCGLGSPVRVRF